MKFVEDHRTDASHGIVPHQTAKQNALRHKLDARLRGGNILKTDLEAHFPAGAHTPFGGDAQGEQSRCQTPRLRHDDPAPHHATIDEYLRQLR